MIDLIYKLARKSLPNDLYKSFAYSIFGRRKRWETLPTYDAIFSRYQKVAAEGFQNKTVLEAGCGNQIFTALHFLNQGACKVFLVDPKIATLIDSDQVSESISEFRKSYSTFPYSEDEVKRRIIEAKDLSEITAEMNGKVDYLFTHLVLEHVADLDSFLHDVNRVLNTTGFSYHIVDLSDHTYHAFTRFKATRFLFERGALTHLRYSDKTFKLINDERCYMNRFLLPFYLKKAAQYNLDHHVTEKHPYKKVPIHQDLLKNLKFEDGNDMYLTGFEIVLKNVQ